MRSVILSWRVVRHGGWGVVFGIAALVVGLTPTLVYVAQHHVLEQADRQLDPAYRVFRVEGRMPAVFGNYYLTEMPGPLAELLRVRAGAHLTAVSRYYPAPADDWRLRVTEESYPVHLGFADRDFASLVQLPVLSPPGASGVRLEPGTILLTRSTAYRLFGHEDVVGRTVVLRRPDGARTSLTIAAVLADHEPISHFRFDALVTIKPHLSANAPPFPGRWRSAGMELFVKLPHEATAEEATHLLHDLVADVPPVRAADGSRITVSDMSLQARPLVGMDFHTPEPSGRPNAIYRHLSLFGLFAGILLALGAVTFLWSFAVTVLVRGRIFALFSLVGRSPGTHAVQVAGEIVLLTFLALLVCMGIYRGMAPWLFAQGALFVEGQVPVLGLGAAGVAVSLTGGAVFAAYLATRGAFQPLVLRLGDAAIGIGSRLGGQALRRTLVFVLFALGLVALYAAVGFYGQWKVLVDRDPGFRMRGLYVIDQAYEAYGAREAFLTALRQLPGVTQVSQSEFAPPQAPENRWTFRVPGRSRTVTLLMNPVDPAFAQTFGVRLLAGRFFRSDHGGDLVRDYRASRNVVITDTARRLLGFAEPADAVGERIVVDGGGRRSDVPVEIVGVVADMALQGTRRGFVPRIFFSVPGAGGKVAIRYDGNDPQELTRQVAAVWSKFVPNMPLHFESVAARWRAEARAERRLVLEMVGVVFAVGLLALSSLAASASFALHHHWGELALRRLWGASAARLAARTFWILGREALVAVFLAAPIAWLFLRWWLAHFPIRWNPDHSDLVWPAVMVVGLVALVLSFHLRRAVRLVPAQALRYE